MYMPVDATKAFDCVRYDNLFELLLKKDIPGTVIRLLLDSYTRQYAYTRWNNYVSTPVKMENGVKQGGVLWRHYFVYTLMNCYEDYGKLMWAAMYDTCRMQHSGMPMIYYYLALAYMVLRCWLKHLSLFLVNMA